MYLDETTFNDDGAITALRNSAIDHLVSLRALSNTLQHLPLVLLLFLFSSILHFFFLLAGELSLLISLLFLLAEFVYIELSVLPDVGLW